MGERLGMQWLELIPRDPESDLVRVLLVFVGPELRHMELSDKFGQISRFRFSISSAMFLSTRFCSCTRAKTTGTCCRATDLGHS